MYIYIVPINSSIPVKLEKYNKRINNLMVRVETHSLSDQLQVNLLVGFAPANVLNFNVYL